MKKEKAFTLIELVMVIAIIGILAAVAVPIFVSFQNSAFGAQEEGVAGAIRSAVAIKYSQNIANGTKSSAGDYWPEEDPFTLLAQRPQYKIGNPNTDADGASWVVRQVGGETAWYIHCPHATAWERGTSKGRFYCYVYGPNGWDWGGSLGKQPAGSVWLIKDAEH